MPTEEDVQGLDGTDPVKEEVVEYPLVWAGLDRPSPLPDPQAQTFLHFLSHGVESDITQLECQNWIAGLKALPDHLRTFDFSLSSLDSIQNIIRRCVYSFTCH